MTKCLQLRRSLSVACCVALLSLAVGPMLAHASTLEYTARPGSLVLLLGGDNVRSALGVTPKQERSLDALRAEFRGKARTITEKSGLERADELSKLTAAYDTKALAVLTPEQRAKLRIIEAQALGPWALIASGVQEELGLSATQKARIAEIAAQMDARVDLANERAQAGKISNAKRVAELRKARKSLGQKLDRILTADQRAAFAAMTLAKPAAKN